MEILVPIKLVPETDKVRMDPDTGTMVREGVDSIVNPLDLYAIEAALRLKEDHGGSITVLSMGPPAAERALREALSMGCDRAFLLSDKAFAGSDTWATSRVLSTAIRHCGSFDLIITGERATDGDTGQVGPGIAAWLGIPVLSHVSQLKLADHSSLMATRLTEEGYQRLEVRLPCVLTVVKEIAVPRLPTLRGKQQARKVTIPCLTASDLGLDPETIGLAGSPTRVVKIFHPKVAREAERIEAREEAQIRQAIDRILEVLDNQGFLTPARDACNDRPYEPAAQQLQAEHALSSVDYHTRQRFQEKKEIWTLAEFRGGRLDTTSFELLARARPLADQAGMLVTAVALSATFRDYDAHMLIAHGADCVIALESPCLADFECGTWSSALAALAREQQPEIILAPATTSGRALMPHLAILLGTGLTADCTDLALDPETGDLLQTRPAIGGNIMATIRTPRHRPQMATIRPHSTRPLQPDTARQGCLLRKALDPQLADTRVKILGLDCESHDFENLEAARIVVAGGRGLRKADGFRHVRALASALGAAVGASREAVDRGWIGYPHQVGLSGKTISPDLYLCAGISGAIQHLAGIRTAKTIIAINSDPHAPIHEVANLAIIGDLFEIMPRLTKAVLQVRQAGRLEADARNATRGQI